MSRFFLFFKSISIVISFELLFTLNAFCYDWVKVAPDFEIKEIPVRSNPIFGSSLLFIKTSLNKFNVRVIRAQEFGKKNLSAEGFAKRSGAIVAINANFFDEYGNPLGLVINRGKKFKNVHNGGKTLTGIFSANRTSIKITGRANIDETSILEAVQAGPRLVANGTVLETKNSFQNSKRSGVCIDKDKNLIIFCTSNTFSGISLDTLQNTLVSEEIECQDALNFDGGGSSQIYISNKIPNLYNKIESRNVPGNDNVPVALGLFVK